MAGQARPSGGWTMAVGDSLLAFMALLRGRDSRPAVFRITSAAAVLLAGWGAGGCGDRGRSGSAAPDTTLRLEVRVMSDTGARARLEITPPPLAVWVASVSPARPADPASLPPPEPGPELEIPLADPPLPPGLVVDPDLKPPILRTPALLTLPAGGGRGPRSVELDVRVAEDGAVSDALWAGGSEDSLLVRAAVESALGMRFYPALKAGRPVAVWCRQRFDFGP